MILMASIDPNVECGWVAHWRDTKFAALSILPRFQAPTYDCDHDEVIVERPTVYPGSRKVDPQDLIRLSVAAGRWAQMLAGKNAKIVEVEPRAWKGQVNKNVTRERVDVLLSPDEKRILRTYLDRYKVVRSQEHNAYDAVGIGAWALGRYT